MVARLVPVLAVFLTAACASQADRELEAVKSARSVFAEWALVEQQAAKGQTPATYAGQMRELARDQLKTAQEELARQPQAVGVINDVSAGPPDAAALKQAAAALEPLEKRLESA